MLGNNGFIKLSELYCVPNMARADVDQFSFADFFRIEDIDNPAFLQAIYVEGRLTAHLVGKSDFQRDTLVATIRLDKLPFAVALQGRTEGGTLWVRRWITSPSVFGSAEVHFRQMLYHFRPRDEEADFVSGDTELPTDILFEHEGENLGAEFGIEAPKLKASAPVLYVRGVLTQLGGNQGLVLSKNTAPPSLLRRGEHYFQFDRPLTAEEHDRNPRIRQFSGDRPFAFVYTELSGTPPNYRNAVRF